MALARLWFKSILKRNAACIPISLLKTTRVKVGKSILALVVGAVMVVVAYVLTGTNSEREFVLHEAERYAREYLDEPDTRKLNVVGERALLSHCAQPVMQVEYSSYEKRKYEFKVTCAGGKVGYLFVSMRAVPPAFIVVGKESGWLRAEKAP